MADEAPVLDTTVRPLKEDELRLAFSGPAPLVTRTLIQVYGTTVRFSFVEHIADPPQLRAAISMNIGDAAVFSSVLQKMLQRPQTAEILKSFLKYAAEEIPAPDDAT